MKLKLTSLILFFLTFLFGFSFTTPAFADTFTLSGRVSDSANNSISNATIDVVDVSSNTNVASVKTDGGGNYNTSIDGGIYNVQVTPPAGSSFGSAITLSQNIVSDRVIDFVLVATGSITISGHVYDALGEPVPNFSFAGTTTDSNGYYLITTDPGRFDFELSSAANPGLSGPYPQNWRWWTDSTSFTESTVMDIRLPFKRVTVHVQDSAGDPISGALVSQPYMGSVRVDIAPGVRGLTSMSTSNLVTNESGNVDLWLWPTLIYDETYQIDVTPPSGTSFTGTSITGVRVTDDMTQTVTLQGPITLSGHVYDALGNPVPNFSFIGTTTDFSGYYSIITNPGRFDFEINSMGNPGLTGPYPQSWRWLTDSTSFAQSTTMDVRLPFKKMTVHVQDTDGNPISGASVSEMFDPRARVEIAPGVVGIAFARNDNIVTDGSGNAELWLWATQFDGAYDISVSPPSGTSFTSTTVTNVHITDDMTQTITLQAPITIQGHIFDALGNPIPNFSFAGTTTGPSGNYLITTNAGRFDFELSSAANPGLSGPYPQNWRWWTDTTSFAQSTIMDIRLPFKKVSIHVQNSDGNPISGASVSQPYTGSVRVELVPGVRGLTSVSTSNLITDASGNVDLWLWPTLIDDQSYTINVSPPSGSDYLPFSLSNITVISDQTKIISLQSANNAPVVGQVTPSANPIQVNTPITINVNFTDINSSDTHTAVADWDDGLQPTACTVSESNHSVTCPRPSGYLFANVYSPKITVTDNHGAFGDSPPYNYLSVYNPTPQGIFSGARIFTSPAGADPANPSVTGQVKFGVTAKYQNGVPTGNVSMDFKSDNLTFNAMTITALVTASGKATLFGTGTINGAGNYNFLVTGIDGANDTIRFKITNPANSNAVVYDSQIGAADTADPTAAVTGQVIVH